eukprot:TRINITY_DN62861_c0_g1_i1.p1 TRINITY_DN62861_c0_g1~~TRINITY_DN62861_c0_g1_i1.p1  ORF type:complete len:432 (-),score=60.64 TRINITY_DN62861_c0_g1_i1:293-1588(-)
MEGTHCGDEPLDKESQDSGSMQCSSTQAEYEEAKLEAEAVFQQKQNMKARGFAKAMQKKQEKRQRRVEMKAGEVRLERRGRSKRSSLVSDKHGHANFNDLLRTMLCTAGARSLEIEPEPVPPTGGVPDKQGGSYPVDTELPDKSSSNKSMKDSRSILVIYTGGTIGCAPAVAGEGMRPGSYFETQLGDLPTLRADDLPAFRVVSFEQLLDSACMAPIDWIKIAQAIEDEMDNYDGFVVLHGTDTMAYTASALSFLLDDLRKPVVLTGSQLPFFEVRTDGLLNLLNAMILAATEGWCDVGLYFNGKLLRGNRTTKVHASNFMAFDSPNLQPLAMMDMETTFSSNLSLKAFDSLPIEKAFGSRTCNQWQRFCPLFLAFPRRSCRHWSMMTVSRESCLKCTAQGPGQICPMKTMLMLKNSRLPWRRRKLRTKSW